jgi:DNA anti-recombination protein RmuC
MEVMTAMDANSTRWNDERLDEFAGNVDKRFDKVDERFDRVDKRFDKVDHELGRVNDRIDDLVKVLIGGIIAFTAAILSGFIAMAIVIATQT